METEIIVAIIGAVAVVVASVIPGIFSLVKSKKQKDSNTKIVQNQSGNHNTQIGIQNNYGEKHND